MLKNDKCRCKASLIISPDTDKNTSWVISKRTLLKVKGFWKYLGKGSIIYDYYIDKDFGYKGIKIECCENNWFIYKKVVLKKNTNIITQRIDIQESIENLVLQTIPDESLNAFKALILKNNLSI